MIFEYTDKIEITDAEINEMVDAVVEGSSLYEAIHNVVAGYDDDKYYAVNKIYDNLSISIWLAAQERLAQQRRKINK